MDFVISCDFFKCGVNLFKVIGYLTYNNNSNNTYKMESQNGLESDAAQESTHTLGDDFAEVLWTVLSTGTAFVLLLFIVTCIRVLIIGKYIFTILLR